MKKKQSCIFVPILIFFTPPEYCVVLRFTTGLPSFFFSLRLFKFFVNESSPDSHVRRRRFLRVCASLVYPPGGIFTRSGEGKPINLHPSGAAGPLFAAPLMEICHGRVFGNAGGRTRCRFPQRRLAPAETTKHVWHHLRPRARAHTQAAKRCFTRCLVERKTEAQTWNFSGVSFFLFFSVQL